MIAISKYNKQHPLRVFEAFAGYGSQSLAFKYIQENHPEFDFKVVGYSEIEPSAIQAYRLLHGWDIPNFGDVTRIDWNEVPDFDFISWSSPCQDFSNAGLRKGGEEGSGTRSSLIFQEKRMLAVKKPKYVMLENVKGLLSEKMRKYFFQYLRDLDSFGYTSFYKILNSKDYGIPQNRERIFVISILRTEDEPNPEYHFPSPIKLETTVEDMLEDNVSPEYFLSQQHLEKYLSKADINESIKKLYPEDSDTKNSLWMISFSYSQYRHVKCNELHLHGSLSERWSFNHQENLMCDKIIKLANLQIKGRIEQQTRVYSTKGISPTLNSAMGHGGNCIPLFLIVKEI